MNSIEISYIERIFLEGNRKWRSISILRNNLSTIKTINQLIIRTLLTMAVLGKNILENRHKNWILQLFSIIIGLLKIDKNLIIHNILLTKLNFITIMGIISVKLKRRLQSK